MSEQTNGRKIETASLYETVGDAMLKNGEEMNKPINVMKYPSNQEPTPINGFEDEGDIFEGKTREDLLEELGKTGLASETVTGTVVEDVITGQRLPSNSEINISNMTSLQDLQPENIKYHLANIVKQNLVSLIPDDLTDEDADQIVAFLEQKLITVDRKEIKLMTANQVKDFYGHDLFNQIKKFNPTDYVQLARKLLIDFKDGIIEFEGVVDSVEEINKHMKFFQDINVDEVQAGIKVQIENDTETYPTEFHKYKKYLELYLEYLNNKAGYENNPFMEKEKEITNEKIHAISDALQFSQIYKKVDSGKQKLLKDFKNSNILNKTIFDFVGKLNNDNSINISFPVPKNFNVKTNVPEILTSIWIGFLEMAIVRGQYENIKSLTSPEYIEMTMILRGNPKKQPKEKDEVVNDDKIDLEQFIKDNEIKISDIIEARKAAIAISYIIARTFKPTIINNSQYMKYVLSYTMNILTQSLYNNGCNKLLLELVDNIRTRLT